MKSDKVLKNFIWRFLERCGAQVVTFVVSVVLARILDPEVYGTIALVTVIISILDVFVNSGFGNALIQKKDADNVDFSTVFYFNVFMCLVLYSILFLSAPLIASFYNIPELTNIVRVLGLTIVVSGVKNIQQAYVSKNMLFKKFFFSTLSGTIVSAIVGIIMAIKGFGVWALVAQHLTNLCIDTFILWITVKWRPIKAFSFFRLKSLFSYGWKLLIATLLDTVYNNLRQLIIGKKYTAEDLAFYNKGQTFPSLLVQNINSSINSVLLPALSEMQDKKESVKAMTRRAIKTSSFLIWPMMVGLGVCAEPLVRLILTDKWLTCVPYMRIFCFTYALYPIHTSNLNAIKAVGRSDIFLKLEIEKKVIGMIVLLSTMWFGVDVMAYSLLLTTIISSIINAHPNKELLNYGYLEQIKDIAPSMFLSFFMGAIVYCFTFLKINDFFVLLIQVPVGCIIYFLGAKILKFETYSYIINLAKNMFNKKLHKRTN